MPELVRPLLYRGTKDADLNFKNSEGGRKMKRFTALTIAGLLILSLSATAIAHGGGRGRSDKGMGRGQMGAFEDDEKYRRGWMHRGYGKGFGPGQGYCCKDAADIGEEGLTSADQATARVEGFLAARPNPNLKVGEVTEKEDSFEVDIVTQDGSLANKVIVDKKTGRLFPFYR
jgi:hypothetical protein